jgi:RNA polymerase sigma factor (sigma-70 family)
MIATDQDLLGQFTREQSQDAFTMLVHRHLNLVYSAALRQVRSPQLAEEVSQTVFTQLAHSAANLKSETVLTAWLYQATRNAAIDVVRHEARRQAREKIAIQMSDMNDAPANWTRIEPILDDAMQSLDDKDRAAILLRYFENKSLREVGEALGSSEDAAQKRVSRAVDQLRQFLSKRKVTVGAGGLVALVSANAVQGAPLGMAAAIAAGTFIAPTAVSTSTALTVSKAIAMTTIQKTIIVVVAAAAVAGGVYQARQISNLREQVRELQQQQQAQADANSQLLELQHERDRATNALAALAARSTSQSNTPNELLKLRGEVGRLRQENTSMGSSSALSKVTASPEAVKLLRDQQKLGMSLIYKGFAKTANLTTEQSDALNNLLADHIMENVGHVTSVLRDKPSSDQMNQIFASEDAALRDKVQALLGADGLAQYDDYTKNLLSTLTADQFKGMLTGDDAAKEDKTKQLRQLMQQEVQSALSDAGLPGDYQTVPILNFRNIASESDGDQALQLLNTIYQNVAAHESSFLTPDEIAKFQEFKTTAINNNRAALKLNRTLMAPISN